MALTISEIASALSYSKSHVLNLVKSGELKAIPRHNPRGKYLIDEADFARYQERIASRDKTGREFAYILLGRYIGQLPDTFTRYKVEQAIKNLASELDSLSMALAPLPHPYQYWSGMTKEISTYANELLESDLFVTMLTGDSMRLLKLLERDLRACIRKLRDGLTGKQDPAVTRDMLAFRDRMFEWSGLCVSWAEFRDTAARCFNTRRSDEKYGELKHPASVVIYDARTRRELVWNAFGLMCQPVVMATIAKWFAQVTQMMEWQFDTICSISASALPLSAFLAWELRKNVVALDNQTLQFQPPQPPGARYILLDTVCQTGNHLLQSVNKARELHKQIAGVTFITINDMMPEEKKRQRFQIIDDMKNEGRLVYCYDMSYLYHRFVQEQLSSEANHAPP
ncbi:MAG TPA: helix-turn-helix domain-containing protein [Dehalococcoidales bacterium]